MQIATHIEDEIEETFDRLDENGDRSISFAEFAALMLDMDRGKSQAVLRAQFETIDTNHDGCVSFDELRSWMSR